jgi:hypothetical protein
MALTVSQYQDLILAELNVENTPKNEVLIVYYWDLHADKGSTALQYLYAKRSAIDALLGGAWTNVDVGTGSVTGKVSLSQQTANLQKMRDNVEAEIKRLHGCMTVSAPTAAAPVFIGTPTGEFG